MNFRYFLIRMISVVSITLRGEYLNGTDRSEQRANVASMLLSIGRSATSAKAAGQVVVEGAAKEGTNIVLRFDIILSGGRRGQLDLLNKIWKNQ